MDNEYCLFLLPTDSMGGAERVAYNLANYLARKNKKIVVYFFSRGRTGAWSVLESFDNVNIIYNSSKRELFSLGDFAAFLFGRRSVKYEFVYSTHLHINALSNLLVRLRMLRCERLIVRESTVIFDRFKGWKRVLFRTFYSLYGRQNLTITQTEYMKERLLLACPKLGGNNLKTIKNPISIDLIERSLTDSVELNSAAITILYVGRLIEVKNLGLLIRSLGGLRELGRLEKEFKLIILGDGPLKGFLIDLVSEIGIEASVDFVGVVKNPYKYMAAADIGVLSSIKEGFPNVIVEMMAAGTKNIITTPCAGGLDELEAVEVLSDFEVKSMKKALHKAINSPVDNREIYSLQSRKRDVRTYWQEILNSLS